MAALTPAQWVQMGFMLATTLIFPITIAPSAVRKLLLDYGARRAQDNNAPAPATKNDVNNEAAAPSKPEEGFLVQVVAKLTSFGQIPHSWFFTFYAFYIICAEAWALQYFWHGRTLLGFLANSQVSLAPDAPTMTTSQVGVLWFMMVFQAARRLYECFVVMNPSKSTMWFVHWVMGLGYYGGVSVAIWVEGSAALLHNQPLQDFTADSRLKISIALPLFLFGSVMQYQCHKHLASLKKYTLPESGMFSNLVCPHYTCECLIYLSLVIAGAPAGLWYNKTLLSVLAFVAVNLGGTAYGTRSWYVDKFGPERVVDKWMMIPFVY